LGQAQFGVEQIAIGVERASAVSGAPLATVPSPEAGR
jgi:hypothetical protein